MKRLWEFDHPYYASEGNYFSNDCHMEFESWAEFVEDQGDADFDYNLVYRWDWRAPDPEDERESHTLEVFWIGQRKALARSTFVRVEEKDEAEVRAWLTLRAEHLRLVWEPLLDGGAS